MRSPRTLSYTVRNEAQKIRVVSRALGELYVIVLWRVSINFITIVIPRNNELHFIRIVLGGLLIRDGQE